MAISLRDLLYTFVQILYQVVILGTIYLKGDSVLHADEEQKQTIVFNAWVLCQASLFTSSDISASNVENKDHYKQNLCVRIGLIIMVVLMLGLVNVAAGMSVLRWDQWGACIAIGATPWLIAWVYSQLLKLLKFSFPRNADQDYLYTCFDGRFVCHSKYTTEVGDKSEFLST